MLLNINDSTEMYSEHSQKSKMKPFFSFQKLTQVYAFTKEPKENPITEYPKKHPITKDSKSAQSKIDTTCRL